MLPRERRLVAALAAATVVGLGLAACGSGGGSSSPDSGIKTITIGELAHLTGVSSGPYGIPFDEGFKFGIEQVNNANVLGGVQLKVRSQDVAGEVPAAVTGFSQYTRDGIDIIVSPNATPVARAITPLAKKQKVFFLTGASVEDTVDNTFGLSDTYTPNVTIGRAVGTEHRGRVIAIEDGDNPAFKQIVGGFTEGLTAAGGSLADTVTISEKDTDFSSTIAKIKSENADTLFIGTLSVQSGNLLTQLKAAGFDGQIVGNSAWQVDVFKTAGPAAEGVEFPSYWVPGTSSDNGFSAAFEKAKGKAPETYSAIGYQAAWLIAGAIQSVQQSGGSVNGQSVTEAISAATSSPLVTEHGPIGGFSFTAGGAPKYAGVLTTFATDGKIITAS